MARLTSAISRLRSFSVAWSFVPCAFIACPHSPSKEMDPHQYLGQNEQSVKVRQRGSTMLDAVRHFAGAKYLNLETFRRTGIGERTPSGSLRMYCTARPPSLFSIFIPKR